MLYKQLRPPTKTIQEQIYSILEIKFKNIFLKKIKILDLFAGEGTFGILMLKRKDVEYCLFVENSFKNYIKLKKKLSLQFQKNSKIIKCDCFKFNFKLKFDLLFIDPPFKFNLSNKLIKTITKQNFISNETLFILRKHENDILENHENIEILHEYYNNYNHVVFFKKIN